MNENNIKAVQEALAPIAEKIGEGAGYSWEVIVMGKFVEGIGMFIGGLIMALVTAVLLRVVWRETAESYDKSETRFFTTLCALLVFFLAGMFVYQGLERIIIPEYAAMQSLLDIVQ